MEAKKILITGGSGLVGRALSKLLSGQGYEVSWLSRRAGTEGAIRIFAWHYPDGYCDPAALDGVHAIVHLAGAGIADQRWTRARKSEIVQSRVATAQLLFDTAQKLGKWPATFVTAGGINYYGTNTGAGAHTEADPPGTDFLAQCCVNWEAAAHTFSQHSRVVILRTGVVLAAGGGALPKMAAPVKWGLGAALGTGRQYVPWIHIDDLCAMYLHAITHANVAGAYNAVAPQHCTNMALTKAIAHVLGKPLWLPPVPGFVLRMALGEMSALVLEGSMASAKRIQDTGFRFAYPDLEEALRAIYKK
jgi:uncharacterized protein (TIGR01777 family)